MSSGERSDSSLVLVSPRAPGLVWFRRIFSLAQPERLAVSPGFCRSQSSKGAGDSEPPQPAFLGFAECDPLGGLDVNRVEMIKGFCALGSNGAPSNLLNCLLWPVERRERTAKPC